MVELNMTRREIPKHLQRVRVATKEEILAANQNARERGWTGSFSPENLRDLIADGSKLLVCPILINHPLDPPPTCYRCLVSLQRAGPKRERLTSLMDIDEEGLLRFREPDPERLNRIVRMLIEANDWVNFDAVDQMPSG